jgi:clan AA aspartic protease (TIGR02281 family)
LLLQDAVGSLDEGSVMGNKIWPYVYFMQMLVLLLPSAASGEVFKCIVDGRVSYSSSPCLSGAVPYDAGRISVNDESADTVTVTRDSHGTYSLPGSINGRSVNFIVDTGASFTTISGDFAKTLGINKCLQVGITHTANGDAPMCRVKISSLSFGGFSYSNISVSLSPNMQGIALIGNDLLSRLKVNQQAGVMVLSK